MSVCVSVALMYCIKTAKPIVMQPLFIYLFKNLTVHIKHEEIKAQQQQISVNYIARSGTCHLRPANI